MAEIETGKLAERKAVTPDARKFGQKMAEDHGKAYEQVVRLAKAKSIALPLAPDRSHKRQVDKLSGLAGVAFDLHYVTYRTEPHAGRRTIADTQSTG